LGLEDSALPPGFKSPEARRKFFIAAGLAAAAVVALQALLWVWLSSSPPAAGEPPRTMRLENVHAETAVVWRGPSAVGSGPEGDLWYVAGEITGGFEGPENRENNRLVHLTAQGPMKVLMLASGAAWLLPQGDTLWIFASDGVSKYDGTTAAQVSAKQLSASESQPFLLDGLPAAVREEADATGAQAAAAGGQAGAEGGQAGERCVVALADGQWVEKAQLFFGDAKGAPPANRVKALEIGGQPYVFCPKGDTLYCHKGFPGKDTRFPADWETVGPGAGLWAVAANEGQPEAFTVKMEKGQPFVEIVGFRRDGGAESAAGQATLVPAAGKPASAAQGAPIPLPATSWKQAFSRISAFPLRALGAATDGADGCRVVYQALQWTVNVVRLDGEKLVSAQRYGDISPAERARALLEVLRWAGSGALSVALAIALSGLMKAYRTGGFLLPASSAASPLRDASVAHSEQAVRPSSAQGVLPTQCASLTRRALALLLDSALVLGPLVAGILGMLWILPGIEDRADASRVGYLVMLLYGGAMWALAAFFILCHRLGRSGRTPGKWAMSIRVLGMDLAPCGFGRALLRSVLLIVDGLVFMDGLVNFSLGALAIACSVNRQRMGDMVARTIVVREAAHPAPVQSLDVRA
jgi:uncharacterized RDD family membrane protein YckC